MALVHETEVEGVRTFWVDSGRPTLVATLMFRVGAADERLTTSGWLHLLEHMALHGLPRGTLAVNGAVSPLLTMFTMHGPPDQVAAALAKVTGRLTEPDLAELDRERRVLGAEAATRGGPVQRAFGMRYGAAGPGLVSYDDVALGRADADHLRDLSRRAFCAANAALALDGPPPGSLRLALAAGTPWPITPARQVERSRSTYPEAAGLVMSGVVGRTAPGTLVGSVVEDALRRTLREREGSAYAPFSTYEAIDADHALVVAGSDVSPETAPSLLGTVIDVADDLAAHGPDPGALADLVAALRQERTDPYNVTHLSHRAAAQSLRGEPVEQLDDVLAELDAETVESVRDELVRFRDSLIVGAPPGTSTHTRMPVAHQQLFPGRHRGTRSSHWPADSSRIAVSDEMVAVGDGRGHVRYPLDSVAGYLTWDSGARGLVLADGWSFTLEPTAWSRGDALVRRLDQLVPADRHLPQPGTTAPQRRSPASAADRWAGGLRRVTSWSPELRGLLRAVLVLVMVVAAIIGAVVVSWRTGSAGPVAVTGILIGLLSNLGKDED